MSDFPVANLVVNNAARAGLFSSDMPSAMQLTNAIVNTAMTLANLHIENYTHCLWQTEVAKDNLGFIFPAIKGNVPLSNSNNYFSASVSPRVAGIGITIMAVNRMVWSFHHMGEEYEGITSKLVDFQHALEDWVFDENNKTFTAKERKALYSFLD